MQLRSTDAERALQDEMRAFLARIVVREQRFGDAAHHERRLGHALAALATAEVG